jgi:hypothetical protein
MSKLYYITSRTTCWSDHHGVIEQKLHYAYEQGISTFVFYCSAFQATANLRQPSTVAFPFLTL